MSTRPRSSSRRSREPAPLHVDAQALCEWLLGRLEDDPRPLARQVCEHALAVLAAIVLALKGRRREEQLDEADERLLVLRALLRLAGQTKLLTERQLVHAFDLADRVGRQLGGWHKQLEAAW